MADHEKIICNWRVTRGIPSGLHLWFDPEVESVRLYRVPTRDQQLLSGGSLDTLDAGVGPGYLDKVVSVRADEGEGEDTLPLDLNGQDSHRDSDLPF